MKKKIFAKIASVMLCFMCLFFVGCSDGGPGGLFGGDYQKTLDGVKVLTRPADYNFADAVGKYSVNYYNLFARSVLDTLYGVYEDNSIDSTVSGQVLLDLDTENGQTFGTFSDDNKYYFYDTIRYTVTNVSNSRTGSGSMVGQVLTLDLNSGWNWNINYNTSGKEIVFKNVSGATISSPDVNNKLSVNLEGAYSDGTISGSWEDIYAEVTTSSFGEVYAGSKVEKDGDATVVDYYISPYYSNSGTEKNYYQDALEYATYCFVLGYDYKNGGDLTTVNADMFNFEISKGADGFVKQIYVGRERKEIKNALSDIKQEYQKLGNFVGVTPENKEQIIDFILDKVIGEFAYQKDKFDVVISDASGNSSISFNRNYDIIVRNVVNYACTQAPIGYNQENDTQVNLDEAFLVSVITDYSGDYFYVVDDDQKDAFRYITPAEYQSIVLRPTQEDVGKRLTDLHLAFEYYDYDLESMAGLNYDIENGLKINVGVRYFDSSAGQFTLDEQTTIVVKYGKDSELDDPEENTVIFSEDDYGDDEVRFENKVTIGSQFNNAIGNFAIDPFAGQESTEEVKSIIIKGDTNAKDYYKLNKSSDGGFFGSLNEQMFIGADGCDYIEIYFDIVKDENVESKNYNFKVGLRTYYTMDEDF